MSINFTGRGWKEMRNVHVLFDYYQIGSTKYNNLGEVVDDLCRIVVAPNNYSSIYFDLINGSFRNSTNTEFVTMTSITVDRDGITTDPIKITASPLTHMMTFARDKSVRDFVLKRM